MSSRFMHVVARGRIPWIIFRRVYIPHVYLIIHQGDAQVASTSCLLWKCSYRRGCEVAFLFSPVLMPIIKWHIESHICPFHFCHFKAKVNYHWVTVTWVLCFFLILFLSVDFKVELTKSKGRKRETLILHLYLFRILFTSFCVLGIGGRKKKSNGLNEI